MKSVILVTAAVAATLAVLAVGNRVAPATMVSILGR